MNIFCIYCNSVLNEKTLQGILQFTCECCGYTRGAQPEETLLYVKNKNKNYESDITSYDDIIDDEISKRIKIDCKCGSKIGVLRVIGNNCDIIKICLNCKTSF